MAIWKVSPERISLYQHPNADKLLVARVGLFPLVVGKSNNFEDGQIVIFAPKRSLLPEWLRSHYNNEETGESYLKNGTTVRSVTLRGQLSEGCTISPDIVNEKLIENEETKEFPQFIGKTLEDLIGEDISPLLGITEYIPPIPDDFAGELEQITGINVNQHDVESFTIFKDEFSEDEEVVVTEKVHGSQLVGVITEDMELLVSSKGFFGNNFSIIESERNIYWKAVRNTKIKEIIMTAFPGQFIQFFAEIIPCQKGYDYGFTEKTLRIYRLEVDGVVYNISQLMEMAKTNEHIKPIIDLWVPILYIGKFDIEKFTQVSKGTEKVSGKNLHGKEGCVIEPIVPRLSKVGNFQLYVKLLNPKFKGADNDDAMS